MGIRSSKRIQIAIRSSRNKALSDLEPERTRDGKLMRREEPEAHARRQKKRAAIMERADRAVEVVRLRCERYMSYPDIARELGISTATVHSIVHEWIVSQRAMEPPDVEHARQHEIAADEEVIRALWPARHEPASAAQILSATKRITQLRGAEPASKQLIAHGTPEQWMAAEQIDEAVDELIERASGKHRYSGAATGSDGAGAERSESSGAGAEELEAEGEIVADAPADDAIG